jgi:hypothetical protein
MSTPFLDKFSPEVRAIIYGHVFGPATAVTSTTRIRRKLSAQRTSRYTDTITVENEDFALLEREIHTNILATNNQIHMEAIPVLYATRVVRGSITQMQELIQSRNDGFWNSARRVEIMDCNNESNYHGFLTTLHRLRLPSRIRSIVIRSNCLTEVDVDLHDNGFDDDDVGTTVSEFAESAMLGPVICVDIGVYMIQGGLPKVRIVNSKLFNMWHAVRTTPLGYDGLVDAMANIDSLGASVFGYNVPAWASQISFRCWVYIQQQFLRLCMSGKWAELTQKAADGTLDSGADEVRTHHFFNELQDSIRSPISGFRLLGSREHNLKDLNPTHPHELLQEATEFLASNLAGYKELTCHVTELPQPILYSTSWFEWRDDINLLSVIFKAQSVALQGGPAGRIPCTKEFVLDPGLDLTPSQNNLISRHTAVLWLMDEQHNFSHIGRRANLNDAVQFTSLTHLFMALQPYEIIGPDTPYNYQSRRDSQSGDLLTSYILASSRGAGIHHLVLSASEGDLRLVVWTVIELLARTDWGSRAFVQRSSRTSQPPSNFARYVDPYIGWTHGRLLSVAAKRLLSETHQIAGTLAAQWVRDSTSWEEE